MSTTTPTALASLPLSSSNDSMEKEFRTHVYEWDEDKVNRWMRAQGYPGYSVKFKENGINGEILVHLDAEALKELDVNSVGKRLRILASIYHLKVQHCIPFDGEDYVPPSTNGIDITTADADERGRSQTKLGKSLSALEERNSLLQTLIEEVSRLSMEVSKLREQVQHGTAAGAGNAANGVKLAKGDKCRFGSTKEKRPSPIVTNALLNSASTVSSAVTSWSRCNPSPNTISGSSAISHFNVHTEKLLKPKLNTKDALQSGSASPLSPLPHHLQRHTSEAALHHKPNQFDADGNLSSAAIRIYGDRLQNRQNDTYKSFRVTNKDTVEKILQAALKKYNLQDSQRNYALFISTPSLERRLNTDEHPLQLYQVYASIDNVAPIFVLREVRNIDCNVNYTL